MKTVIRIEHPSDGLGLWQSRNKYGISRIDYHSCYEVIFKRHTNPTLFPCFWDDQELKEQICYPEVLQYNYAFLSLEQLKTALTDEELKECITDLGFKVLMLDVTDYFESKYQVVFKKSSITSTKDISFMFL